MAKRYRVEAWTGPSGVAHYAQKLRESGFTEVTEGTERVYGTTEVADHQDSYDARWRTASVLFGSNNLRQIYASAVR